MASIQRRSGPSIIGFWGFFQPIADGLKLLTKERCEKNSYIRLWKIKENFHDQYISKQSFLCDLLFKQVFIGSLKKLIGKNPVDTSNSGRWWFDSSVRCMVVSNGYFHMNALFLNNISTYNSKMGSFNSKGLMVYNFSKINRKNLLGWRGYRRLFCIGRANTVLLNFKRNDKDLSKNIPEVRVRKTKPLIIPKDFNKRICIYGYFVSIIDKISTFKIHLSGKYISLTKNFLTDPIFLKFAFYLIGNFKWAHKDSTYINDVWFKKTALQIKDSIYTFTLIKQTSKYRLYQNGSRIITITNKNDCVVMKAMALVLNMIYEKQAHFQNESHGFRPNKSSHTALKQIKLGWSSIPYYIEVNFSKVFCDINHKVLINILNERINDKRFIDLINKMHTVGILCPWGFHIKKNNGVMQKNVLSPILCNIYFDKLDMFVKHEIIYKMNKGKKPIVNPKYLEKLGLTFHEQTLPDYLKIKIMKSRRRHVEKLGIKKILEGASFIRIKYIRYADNFLIAVRGSLELAKKIKELVKNFFHQVLHLKLNDEKTKVTNTYSCRVKFLGMLIYNINACDLPYRNSREIENTKRVLKKNNSLRNNFKIKTIKKRREKIIKSFNLSNSKEALKEFDIKGKSRAKVKKLAIIVNSILPMGGNPLKIKQKIFSKKLMVVGMQKSSTLSDFCNRIHTTLVKYSAYTTKLVTKQCRGVIKKLIYTKRLIYCPENIILTLNDLEKLIFIGSKKDLGGAFHNWLVVVKKLLALQNSLPDEIPFNSMASRKFRDKNQVLKERVFKGIRPMIVIDRNLIYEKLKSAKIINSRNNPGCKYDLMCYSDYNIIRYFNNIAIGLLSYFRCADDFFKIKNLVDWFIRYSAISTIKQKHKLPSKKAVFDIFGVNPTFINKKDKIISLISRQEIYTTTSKYLLTSDIEWFTKLDLK